MPNTWYHNGPKDYLTSKKEATKYIVIEAILVDSYHYSGSWFEYTWELTVKDVDGNLTTKKLDTWTNYKDLTGKTIKYNGTTFDVVT